MRWPWAQNLSGERQMSIWAHDVADAKEKIMADNRAKEKAWEVEFDAARVAAIDALPNNGEFLVSLGKDGLWRVSRRTIETYPRYYGERFHLRIPITVKPLSEADHVARTRVVAEGYYVEFAPTFLTRDEAEQWLHDFIHPPKPIRTYFDDNGDPIP